MKNIKLFLLLAVAIALITPSFTNAELAGDFDPQGENACILLQNNLRYRSTDAQTNNEVSVLQDYLQANNYLDSNPTGFFGLLTFAAVKKFQTANGIEPTGFVGPLTRGKINLLTCGTPGNPVLPPITPPSIPGCSPGAFYNSETGAPCPGTTQPSITVLSPNGGEMWNIGETKTIKYNSSNISNHSLWIYLERFANGSSVNGYLIATPSQTNGEISYTPTQDVINSMGGLSPYYKIRIWSDATGYPQDYSDNYFTITSSTQPSGLTLTAAPAADGSVHVNASFDPNKYEPIYVALRAICPQGVSGVFVTSPGTDWEACGNTVNMSPIAGPGAYRTVYRFTNTTGSPQTINFQAGMNGFFSGPNSASATITMTANSIQPSITVLSPNGGERWMLNSGKPIITWTPDPHSTSVVAFLEKLVNGQFVNIGKVIVSAKGSILWNGEIDQYAKYATPDSGYYIRLVNTQTGATDRSDQPFTLLPIDYVNVDLEIDGGEGPVSVPASGRNVTITWTSQNATSCVFYPYPTDPGATLTNLPTSGSRVVFIKGNSYSYNYTLSMLCDSPYGARSDYVEVLPSANSAQPSITILSPNGGENLTANQSSLVKVDFGSGGVPISISLKNVNTGKIMSFQAMDSAPAGPYQMYFDFPSNAVNYVSGDHYKIQITSRDFSTFYDDSDNYFTITTTPTPIPILAASLTANGARDITVNVGDAVNYLWSSTNADKFSSSFTGTPATCGSGASVMNSASGAYKWIVPQTSAGCTFVVDYRAQNSDSGMGIGGLVTIRVNKIPSPTASLTANGSHDVTLNVGDTLKYAWSSANGSKFSSYYTSSPTSCGSGASVMNSSSGSYPWVVPNVSAGCTYTVTYYVDSGAGGSKDTVVVRVNKLTPTASLTVSSTHNVASHDITLNVGDEVKYVWTSTNADKASSSFTSNDSARCGAGAWVANTISGSGTYVTPAWQTGCVFTITFEATRSGVDGAKDTVTVRINKTTTTTTQSVNNTNTASALTPLEQFLLWLFP